MTTPRLTDEQRAVIASRGAQHFDKTLLKALLPSDVGEAIATRYDPKSDTYHVATTSGVVIKLVRTEILKAQVRDYDLPQGESRLFDGAGNKITEQFYGPSIAEQMQRAHQEANLKDSKARSFIEQQIREFEKQYQKHAKNRDSIPDGPKGESGQPQPQTQPKPKTFEEAWEMAEARVYERLQGVPHMMCRRDKGICNSDTCSTYAEVQVNLPGDEYNPVPFCAACAYTAIVRHGVGILDSADE